jgi:cytochrome c oxidase subunit 3
MTTATASIKEQLPIRRLGLWLFITSESMIFIALFFARFYMQGVHRPAEVNQVLGLIITSILLISSFTANRAEVLIGQGDRTGFLRNLGTTIILGLVFLLAVVTVEWPEALHFAPPSTGYGTLFFVITGMHAFHVLTGLIILLIVFLQGWQGRYTVEDHWGVQGGVVYWHFVDVVWVFVYPTLYLIGP